MSIVAPLPSASSIVPILAHNFAHSRPVPASMVSPPSTQLPRSAQTKQLPFGRSHKAQLGGPSTPIGNAVRRTEVLVSPNGANDIFSLSDDALSKKYDFLEQIGCGNWGSVFKCQSRTSSGRIIAAKVVHRVKNSASSARVRSLWGEYKCLRLLRPHSHPNIVRFHSFIITSEMAVITMDYHPRIMPVELPEWKTKIYFRQLCDAVAYLHRNGCSHNDIKPANILISASDKPVLCDFGFAQHYEKMDFMSNMSWGTPEFLSPERARGQLHDERLSDIWALGVTLYEVVVGRTPFEMTETEEFHTRKTLEIYYNRTCTGQFFGEYKLSAALEDLIRRMIEPAVALRISSCDDILKHRFFISDRVPTYMSPTVPKGQFSVSPKGTPQRPIVSNRKATGTPKHNRVLEDKSLKIFQDPPETPSRTVAKRTSGRTATTSKGTPSRVLVEKVNNSPSTPLKPLKLDVGNLATPPASISKTTLMKRKSDISSPSPLRKSPSKRFSPPPNLLTYDDPPPPVPKLMTVQMKLAEFEAREKAKALYKRESEQIAPRQVSIVSNVPKQEEAVLPVAPPSLDDTVEVLTDQTTQGFCYNPTAPLSPTTASQKNRSSTSIPTTPLSSRLFSRAFSPDFVNVANGTAGEGLTINTAFEDTTSNGLSTFAHSRSGLVHKLKSMSIRRAPSTLSFRGLKDTMSQKRDRASTASSVVFTMLDKPSASTENRKSSMQKPRTSESALTAASEKDDERDRLESFSRHIQNIIDAKKLSDALLRSPPIRRSSRPLNDEGIEVPILTPEEMQEFKQQVAQELNEGRLRQKASREYFSLGPRPLRSGSVTRVGPATGKSMGRGSVKIRPSLAPSFIDSSPPPASPEARSWVDSERSPESSVASSVSMMSLSTEFRPGHRRIPTAIRTVPSILLTESGDEALESDWARADTPCSERLASPPPVPRVVEAGRQLPTWVPAADSDGDDEDGDVDEPTITISNTISSKLRRVPSKLVTPSPSSTGLFNHFVAKTPNAERRSRLFTRTSPPKPERFSANDPPPFSNVVPTPPSIEAASRSSSRATSHTDGSHKSGMSFFMRSMSRSTLRSETSLNSQSSVATGSEADGNPAVMTKKSGKIKRVFQKLF